MIEELPDNSYVGIVLFDEQVEIALDMTQLRNRSAKDEAIASVPAMARGATNIGSGILWGVELLKRARLATEGATMILATDGENNRGEIDYPTQVLPILLRDKVIINLNDDKLKYQYNLDKSCLYGNR